MNTILRSVALIVLLATVASASGRAQETRGAAAVPVRTLIFSEAMYTRSQTALFVQLDSGVIYRITAHGEGGVVLITPQGLSSPPLRFTPISGTQAPGQMFTAPFTGTYRVYAAPLGNEHEGSSFLVQVTIYQDESDSRELACARDASRAGCRRGPRRTGWLLALASIPIALIMLNR